MKKTITSFVVTGLILAGIAGNVRAQVPPTFKSNIFDLAKQKTVTPPSIGKVCASSLISLNTHEQVLMVEGDQLTFFLDPRTQQAVLCSNGNGGVCPDSSGFISIGTNADGATHSIVTKGNGSKIIPNPASLFADMMTANGKPLNDVIANPTIQSCDIQLKDFMDAAKLVSFQPSIDMSSVELNGTQVPVATTKFTQDGNRFVTLYAYDYTQLQPPPNPLPANNGKLVPGIGILTIGDTPQTVTQMFKAFPANYKAIFDAAETVDVALQASTDKVVTVSLIIGSGAGGGGDTTYFFSCGVPVDASTPMKCDLEAALDKADPDLMKYSVTPRLVEMTLKGTGSADLGAGLADPLFKLNFTSANPPFVAHNFEGYGDVPNFLTFDAVGSHLFRLNPDKTVTEDPNEILPTADLCMLVDLDPFAGTDLLCGTSAGLVMIPKINLPPEIGDMTFKSDAENYRLSAVVKTQEDETLTYAWSFLQEQDGKSVDLTNDLVINPTSATPLIKSVATPGGYQAILTVTDPGGLSAMAMGLVNIPLKSVAAAVPTPTPPVVIPTTPVTAPVTVPASDPKAATVPQPTGAPTPESLAPPNTGVSGSPMFGLMGGCSLIR